MSTTSNPIIGEPLPKAVPSVKPMIIVHAKGYSGNERSVEHLSACLDRKLSENEMCEERLTMHITFTPGHPAVMAFGRAWNVLTTAIDMEEHIRKGHADGPPCPVSEIAEDKDWGEIEAECSRLGIKCDKGE